MVNLIWFGNMGGHITFCFLIYEMKQSKIITNKSFLGQRGSSLNRTEVQECVCGKKIRALQRKINAM